MDFTALLSSYGWPFVTIVLLVFVAILLFRERNGIKTLKLGPFEIGFSEKSQPKELDNNSNQRKSLEAKPEPDFRPATLTKPVNVFYLGWDLGRASAKAQHSGPKNEIEFHLTQACFHTSELDISEGIPERLKHLLGTVQGSLKSQWANDTGARIDEDIKDVVGKIVTIAGRNQSKVNLFSDAEVKRHTNNVEFYNTAELVNGIYKWVEEYLDATALLFSKASETLEEWRAAVDSYERRHASYPRMLVRAKTLKQEGLVKSLELLVFLAEELVKLAQAKWNSSDKDNFERSKTFRTVQDNAVDVAATIYEILNKELAKL